MAGSASPRQAAAGGAGAARRAHRSGAGLTAARAGLAARAVLYLGIAGIIVGIVAGRSSQQADSRGALASIVARPLGAVVVGVLAAAFAAHALWRALEAASAADPVARGGERLTRLGNGAAGVLYAALAAACIGLLIGRSGGSEDASAQKGTGHALGLPLGRPLVVVLGIALACVGVGMAVWALRGGYAKRLRTEAMDRTTRRVTHALEVAGQSSRALLLVVAGALVVKAGIDEDPSRSQAVDGSLRTLAGHPGGSLLLVVMAAGLAAYGLASFIEARYVKST